MRALRNRRGGEMARRREYAGERRKRLSFRRRMFYGPEKNC